MQYPTNTRAYSPTGDILVDTAHNVYSVTALGRVLQVVRYRSDGLKQMERSYGSATTAVTPGDESKIVISKSVITADDNTIYICGHAMESSLTGGSLTYDIFLQRIKASDLTAGWTRSWGLDGTDQHDMAYGLTTTFDGGKILLVG
jgi:hypothetical protein